jgi:hypothetical protein
MAATILSSRFVAVVYIAITFMVIAAHVAGQVLSSPPHIFPLASNAYAPG